METSLKLQRDVRNNAEDLRRYMLELQSWEEEMKRKDIELKKDAGKAPIQKLPPPRNKIKRSTLEKHGTEKGSSRGNKPKKISAYDYSAWDKFDADKACAELDEENSEEEFEENAEEEKSVEKPVEKEGEIKKEGFDPKMIDEAFYEKELGNQFVRKEKWEEAIKCYTKAIDLDPRNAIYYANRSLCFLKLKKSSEVDATVAIQLDDKYVKAYVRRAFARTALGQLKEALSDYRRIIDLEPNNAIANAEIAKLEKKLKASEPKLEAPSKPKPTFDPKSMFKSEEKKKSESQPVEKKVKNTAAEVKAEPKKKDVEESKKVSKPKVEEIQSPKDIVSNKVVEETPKVNEKSVFGAVPNGFHIVKPVHIPPHLRSKKPLLTIPVREVTSNEEELQECSRLLNESKATEETEKSPEPIPTSKAVDLLCREKPTNSVTFRMQWKLVKHSPCNAWKLLQMLSPSELRNILKYDIDSNLFSEIISILSHDEILSSDDADFIVNTVQELSRVERFKSLRMFMSREDLGNIKKIVKFCKMSSDLMKYLEEVYEL